MILYSIRCLVNGRIYIGLCKDFSKRRESHIAMLRTVRHHNWFLQDDYNRYGIDAFKFKIISEKVRGRIAEPRAIARLYRNFNVYNIGYAGLAWLKYHDHYGEGWVNLGDRFRISNEKRYIVKNYFNMNRTQIKEIRERVYASRPRRMESPQ